MIFPTFDQINLQEYTVHAAAAHHKKSERLYLGNEECYRRFAGLKTTRLSRAFQILKQMGLLDFWISGSVSHISEMEMDILK